MPKLGEALKAVVREGEDAFEVKGRPESVLMNPTRQKIFEFICHHPGTRLRPMARKLGMSATVVQFHLRKMDFHQYLITKNIVGNIVYYPSDLRPSDEDLIALAFLADEPSREILRLAVEKPGLRPSEIAPEIGRSVAATRKLILAMESSELIAIIIDGKHGRIFPGDALPKLERRTRKLLRGMKGRLMRRLAKDRLRPEIGMDARRESTIIIRVGEKNYHLRLPSETLMPWMPTR